VLRIRIVHNVAISLVLKIVKIVAADAENTVLVSGKAWSIIFFRFVGTVEINFFQSFGESAYLQNSVVTGIYILTVALGPSILNF